MFQDGGPLQDHSYLESTVQLIATSLHERSSASIHNLLDAYATFVHRVRSQSQILEACDTLLPALVPLSTHRDGFIRALRRDVGLAHFDPFATLSHPRLSLDETTNHNHLDIKIDTKQYARDTSSLCHHALCVITTIIRFPVFCFAFSEHDLSSLFGDILGIALADQLPIPSEAKTYSLSLWALSCHRLPVIVLAFWRDDLSSALQRSLGMVGQSSDIALDGLKALSHTLERHPPAFFEALSPLLPRVMTNLHCKSVEHRIHASIALGQFANALIHQTELSLTKWQLLSDHVMSSLESCCDESQTTPDDTSFAGIIRTAFSTESHARHTDGPARVLAVFASLIVLCGPTLYRKPVVLHFILQSLAMALTHKRSVVRALHAHVWKCFVWTFSQLLLFSDNVEPELISSALHVIKQEVGGGIGTALASVLLSGRSSVVRFDEPTDRLSEALSVIKIMVRTECKHTRREGFVFLRALTSDSQARHQILRDMSLDEIPASVLLNGAVIRAEWDSLPSVIHSIPKAPISLNWPEETEIARHYETLLVIWKDFASKADKRHLDSNLIDVWLSILLACSHQLERDQHTAGVTKMLRHTSVIIIDFLPPVAQPDWGSWDVHDQLCSLAFIDQLWSAVRKAFVALSLAEVAELILTSILKFGFHVLDIGVQTLWGRLCANLMTTASPSFLCDTHESATSQSVIRTQRELWGVIASSISSSELTSDWKEIIKFLSIPICAWVLSGSELEAWETLLRGAIVKSGNSAIVIEHIVSQYLQGKHVETWDPIVAVLGFLLTFGSEYGNAPTDDLLSMVDVCLTSCYSRARHLVLTHSLKLIDVIRNVISSDPGNVMRVLQSLRSSICLWIEDHAEVMSNDEFNSVAVSLYCEVLKALAVLPLSVQALRDTEDFLVSGFSRIPAPATAPFAFERFWRLTYHGRREFYSNLPPKIKSCLACFVAAYGGDLADGLSLTSESQSQSISDSQDHSPASLEYQASGESNLPVVWSSTSMNIYTWGGMEFTPREHLHVSAAQDNNSTSRMHSSKDDAPRPTRLSQLQDYSSRIDVSSINGLERSTSNPRMLLSQALRPGSAMPSSRSPSPERNRSVTSNLPNQKRKLAKNDDPPRKRSRTSQVILRSLRKLASEPATRDVTPVDVPRMHSVPLKKRKVFDGVEVPTFRAFLRRQTAQRTGTTENNAVNSEQDVASVPQSSSPCSIRRRSRTPVSALAPSDEEDLDWENVRVHETSSEADVDQSLEEACLSSPPWARSHDPSRSSPSKAMSRSKGSPLSLRKVKTAVPRLDALRDVYFSVENGASQIPFDELVEATELVHKIGAVLTKQVGKEVNRKMDKETAQ